MFQQLLLAIDDSPGSQVAVSFAVSLAEPGTTSVRVFYVNEYLVGGRGITLHTQAEATDLVADAMRQLNSTKIEATGAVCIASYRQVADRIVEAARDHGADAIVLGSSRRRYLGRLFSRQLRERTTRLTALPVITAPPPLEVAGARFELWDAIKQGSDKKRTVVN